jgi:hypothetical protein
MLSVLTIFLFLFFIFWTRDGLVPDNFQITTGLTDKIFLVSNIQ